MAYLDVDEEREIFLEKLKANIPSDTILISVMAADNEIEECLKKD